MHLEIYWEDGSIEEWDPTFLSFDGGAVLQGGKLLIDNIEENGLRFWRGFITDEGITKTIGTNPFVLVPPERIENIVRIEKDGWTILHTNEYGQLINVAVKQNNQEDLQQIPSVLINTETGEILNEESAAEEFDERTLLDSLDEILGIKKQAISGNIDE